MGVDFTFGKLSVQVGATQQAQDEYEAHIKQHMVRTHHFFILRTEPYYRKYPLLSPALQASRAHKFER